MSHEITVVVTVLFVDWVEPVPEPVNCVAKRSIPWEGHGETQQNPMKSPRPLTSQDDTPFSFRARQGEESCFKISPRFTHRNDIPSAIALLAYLSLRSRSWG
jgi:hypothetical protein